MLCFSFNLRMNLEVHRIKSLGPQSGATLKMSLSYYCRKLSSPAYDLSKLFGANQIFGDIDLIIFYAEEKQTNKLVY